MKYGYFKNTATISTTGILGDYYCWLNKVPNIVIYYDRIGKNSPYFSRLIKKLRRNDSLYITSTSDFGCKNKDIFAKIKLLKELEVKLFIGFKEIDIDGLFKEIKTMQDFNYDHLKGQLRYSDIVDMSLHKFL